MNRGCWLFRMVALVLVGALSLFTAAPLAAAQEPMGSGQEASRGSRDATIDAKVSDGWYLWGFLSFGGAAIWAAVVEPTPPASRLVGKSADYVANYTDTYRKEVKGARLKKACIGGAIGWAAWVLLWVAVWRSTDDVIYYY